MGKYYERFQEKKLELMWRYLSALGNSLPQQ
jgi:hypothetical protein